MRRIIGSVVVVAAVLLGTAACGGGDDAKESGSATTAAATGGSSSGGGAATSDPVAKLCDLVDQVIEAGKAKDAAKLQQLADETKAAVQEATKSIISNPASASKFGECSSKLSTAIKDAGLGG